MAIHAGQKTALEDSLGVLFPDLAKQWNKERNGTLTPSDVRPGSNRATWWFCGWGHEWKTPVVNRTGGTGCPYCSNQTSRLEVRIFSELKHVFGEVEWRKKLQGRIECDIYMPTLKTAIEIDGFRWHREGVKKDKNKEKLLKKAGVKLYRLRDKRLPTLSERDVRFTEGDRHLGIVIRLMDKLREDLRGKHLQTVNRYLKTAQLQNQREYNQILSFLPGPPPDKSLARLNPSLASQWHFRKNAPLTPFMFTLRSGKKVWWICEQGHEWEASVHNRTSQKPTGCPFCLGRFATEKNNLLMSNPEIAKQWHPSKNGNLSPTGVSSGSNKKVWWLCEKRHEWEARIQDRAKGTGCPVCWKLRRARG